MGITNNRRPGVYSRYDISSGYSTPRSAQDAAVAAGSGQALAGKLYSFSSLVEARLALAEDAENQPLLACVRILFACGVTRVHCAGVRNTEDPEAGTGYAAALALLEQEDNVGVLLCDAQTEEDLQLVKQSAESSARSLRERVAFVGVDDPREAGEIARSLNSERVVLCTPGGETGAFPAACTLAGMLLAKNDPAYNWSGEALPGLEDPPRLEETLVQELLHSGVTVFERCGSGVECIRAQTTCSMENGVESHRLRSLNTILIIDDIIRAIRDSLKSRLRGLRMSARYRESIRSQVAVELSAKQDQGLIERFDAPAVYPDSSDPAVCVVELSVQVSHVIEQIHITAHIAV